MVRRAMTCSATMSTQLQNIHLVCFAAHSGPFCTQRPHTDWLVLHGCTAAAVGAHEAETASVEWPVSMTVQASDLPWDHCREEPWGMNAALRLPGEELGLNWEWVGFVVAIRRDTSKSSSSLYTGKNSKISLALLSFSYAPTHVSLYPLRGGFSGEGEHASVVGSSGCLPWDRRGMCLETIPVFHPSSM